MEAPHPRATLYPPEGKIDKRQDKQPQDADVLPVEVAEFNALACEAMARSACGQNERVNHPCGTSYVQLSLSPIGMTCVIGQSFGLVATARYSDRCGDQFYCTVTSLCSWGTSNSSICTVSGGTVTGAAGGGTATITASYTGDVWLYDSSNNTCNIVPTQHSGSSTGTVPIPVSFKQTSGYDAGGGDLHFAYSWSSNTGNLSDISYCKITEKVTYPGTLGQSYVWPTPPWYNTATPNPTVAPSGGASGSDGAITDDNQAGDFGKPYQTATFTAVQTWNYTCGTAQGTLLGPLNIVRSVSTNGTGGYKYTGTKSGVQASINPLP